MSPSNSTKRRHTTHVGVHQHLVIQPQLELTLNLYFCGPKGGIP